MNGSDGTNGLHPPTWMEHLLRMFLSAHHRETIAGDLREEFQDRAASHGIGSAKLWYLRQTVSFAPRGVGLALGNGPVLPLLCAFTGLCGLWLGAMDVRLHHPASQVAIAAAILSQALVTIAALHLRYKVLRYLAMMGCVTMFWLSGRALIFLLRGYDFEGYILLIALLLAVQSVLTICTLPWLQMPPRGKSA
jgi:hypothetical protein